MDSNSIILEECRLGPVPAPEALADSGPGTAVAVVGISAGSIAGAYLLGRHLDKKEITILID